MRDRPPDPGAAEAFAREHVDAYLGGVEWAHVAPAELTRAATSPTAEVRAAWLLGVFDELAHKLAAAAGASPSEVNIHRQLQAVADPVLFAPDACLEDVDRLPPTITITPDEGAIVRGTVTLAATATDAIEPRPTLRITAPAALAGQDADGDATDADVRVDVDTRAVVGDEGPLAITFESTDGTGVATAVRRLVVDNLAPAITIHGVADGAVYRSPRPLDFTVTDSHLGPVTATFTNGVGQSRPLQPVDVLLAADAGECVVAITADDRAGNTTLRTLRFAIDDLAPVIELGGVAADAVVRPPARPTFAAPTEPHLASLTATLDGAPYLSGTDVVAEGPHLLEVTAVDRAGSQSQAMRRFTVDSTNPVLTLATPALPAANALVLFSSVLWSASPTPTLSGTVVDANLRDVRALIGGNEVATATVAGNTWTLTLPAGAVPAATDVTIDLVARDLADNRAMVTHRFRHDATPPALTVEPTEVYNERDDLVSFVDTMASYTVNHGHRPTNAITLGPDECSGVVRTVVKYAYLLDGAQPEYVNESSGPTSDRNPLEWKWKVLDDGIGLAAGAVRYRVLDGTGTPLTGWLANATTTPVLDGTGTIIGHTYKLELTRGGPGGLAALGQNGSFRLELDAADRLGRMVSAARCWNLELLPAPVDILPPRAATNGPAGSGKFGLSAAGLSLAGSVVAQPFAAQVLNPTTNGNGLMEYEVVNPTTEAVYLTIDLTLPASATTTVSYRRDRPMYFNAQPADFYCTPQQPCGGAPVGSGTQVNNVVSGVAPRYGVQIWSVTQGTWSLLTPCPWCNTSAPIGSVRTTVQLPARAANGAEPRRFWVVPVVYDLPGLRPGGGPPYQDRDFWSGRVSGTGSWCSNAVDDPPFGLLCGEVTSYEKISYVTQASFSLNGANVFTRVQLSRFGDQPANPPYLNFGLLPTNPALFFTNWTTTEP